MLPGWAGDSIVVGETHPYRLMKDIKDITQILYQIATGVLIWCSRGDSETGVGVQWGVVYGVMLLLLHWR
jgi:hypothetical protein